MLSDRALINLLPILASLAHDGTRPHRNVRNYRGGSDPGDRLTAAHNDHPWPE